MSFKKIIKRIRAILLFPIYRYYMSTVPISTYIRNGTMPRYSTVGKYCWINTIVGLNCVHMGNYCSIAAQVLIGGMEHPVDRYSTSTLLNDPAEFKSKTTYIGHNVWIGTQCVIKQGVHIGNGAIIGANSFVNKDVPAYSIVAGSPAKVIRFRFNEDTIKALEMSHFWDYPPQKAKEILKTIKGNH